MVKFLPVTVFASSNNSLDAFDTSDDASSSLPDAFDCNANASGSCLDDSDSISDASSTIYSNSGSSPIASVSNSGAFALAVQVPLSSPVASGSSNAASGSSPDASGSSPDAFGSCFNFSSRIPNASSNSHNASGSMFLVANLVFLIALKLETDCKDNHQIRKLRFLASNHFLCCIIILEILLIVFPFMYVITQPFCQVFEGMNSD